MSVSSLEPRTLLLLALLLGVILLARRLGAAEPPSGPTMPAWWLPLGAGILSAGLTAWVWGGLRAPAVIHDEAAYLLQASLLSRGTWSLPSPILPEAFTQAAVLVTPVLTPKMMPGHALLLAPGVAVGAPGAIPVLLGGLTAALLIVLARRAAGSGVAVITLALWLTQAGQMRWRASYLSQSTTGLLWVLGWWCLIRWRETRSVAWITGVALAAGLGAVTRPLTMLAWAIPAGIVVLHDVARTRGWRQLIAATVAGAICLLLLPIQNRATLGDWRSSPLQLYTRQYLPFDGLGFGLDSTSPLLTPPADLTRATSSFVERHREHTMQNLPAILLQRLEILRRQTLGQWRLVWIPAAIAGAVVLGGLGWFALGSALSLYLAYLLYAHEPQWTAYYAEATPAFAFLLATGLSWILARLARRSALPFGAAAGAALAILLVGSGDFAASRVSRRGAQAPLRHFEQLIATTGAPKLLVFVRYADSADPHLSLVRNVADREKARFITAYDLGTEKNAIVARAFPGRSAFLFDQQSDRLTPLDLQDPGLRTP